LPAPPALKGVLEHQQLSSEGAATQFDLYHYTLKCVILQEKRKFNEKIFF